MTGVQTCALPILMLIFTIGGLLTAAEAERIQGFPTDHTKYCLMDGKIVEMPLRKRRFMMGNALVVDLVVDMEKTLSVIFDNEN